jgi:hypothetical protein
MRRISRYLAWLVLILGVVSVAIGIAFIVEAQAKNNYMKDAMRQEQITLGLDEDAIARGAIVDSGGEAEKAGDTIRGHRRGIAATYNELLDGGGFDPTNPTHVTYMQALNLENYLYLAVLGFGLTTVVTVSGIFMIIAGFALAGTGVALRHLARRTS